MCETAKTKYWQWQGALNNGLKWKGFGWNKIADKLKTNYEQHKTNCKECLTAEQ